MSLNKLRVAKGFWQQTKGLIGEQKIQPTLFTTRFGIHTFGMKVPLDILVLDKHKRVVKVKESLLPNHLFFWNPKYSLVVELPEGFVKCNKIKLGQGFQPS